MERVNAREVLAAVISADLGASHRIVAGYVHARALVLLYRLSGSSRDWAFVADLDELISVSQSTADPEDVASLVIVELLDPSPAFSVSGLNWVSDLVSDETLWRGDIHSVRGAHDLVPWHPRTESSSNGLHEASWVP